MFEIPRLKNAILNFQILFDVRNMELKMSQHIKRTCLWPLTLIVVDIALIWMLHQQTTTSLCTCKELQ